MERESKIQIETSIGSGDREYSLVCDNCEKIYKTKCVTDARNKEEQWQAWKGIRCHECQIHCIDAELFGHTKRFIHIDAELFDHLKRLDYIQDKLEILVICSVLPFAGWLFAIFYAFFVFLRGTM